MDIDELLHRMVKEGASDLHIRAPSPPVLRVDGRLIPQEDLPSVNPTDIQEVFEHVTTPEKRNRFAEEWELDFSYSIAGLARFRVNVMRQRGTLSIAFRLIPHTIPTIDELELPQICKTLVMKPRGLILVTGPTGSGKSTTLAAMIDYLNERDGRNVITIEDPIEYLHHNKKCIVAQRDLGDDTKSFDIALKHALRHDPDVILVGEMRDLETISTAIRAAETGHLVLGTLHTIDAAQTVDRAIDIFPPAQQTQVRLQFAQVIEGILTQTLLPRSTGKGRIAAFEIMVGVPAARNLIRDKQSFKLPTVMELGTKDGMQTLNQALAVLVNRGVIDREEALQRSSSPEQLKKLLQYHSGDFVTEVENIIRYRE
jgi:twitching motility protein PilT